MVANRRQKLARCEVLQSGLNPEAKAHFLEK